MSTTNAFSMPPTENAWADQSTSSYGPTWGPFNTHHTSYTSNYDFPALREASEATSMWKDDAVKDLPSAPSQKEAEGQFRHTADEMHHAEDDDEYSAWNFDAFEAALNEPTATTTEPPAPPQPSNQDVLNAAQSSLATDLTHRTSTLPAADPAEVARIRRLLRWMMVTDYTVIPSSSPLRPTRRAVNSITLPAPDRAHFLHLAALSRRVEALHAARKKKKKKNRTSSSCPSSSSSLRNTDADDEHDVLATYFWQSVHAPCAALGLHPSILLARCLDLAHFSGATGRYDGAERGTLTLFGVGAWARRLFVDRALVLPVVFTSDDDDDDAVVRRKRQQAFAADGGGDAGRVDAAVVREAIERRARVWFEKVEGLEGLVVERGPEEGRWLFTDVCRFRLNERGRKLDARRSRGASGFGKGLCASAVDRRRAVDGAVKSLEGKEGGKGKGKVLDVVGRVKDPRVDFDAAVCVPLLSRFR